MSRKTPVGQTIGYTEVTMLAALFLTRSLIGDTTSNYIDYVLTAAVFLLVAGVL